MVHVWDLVSFFAFCVFCLFLVTSNDERCMNKTSPTPFRYVLWERCTDFRTCFIHCYQDGRCSGFWFHPQPGWCLGHPSGYYIKDEHRRNFFDLCRRKECLRGEGFVKLEKSGLCVKVHLEKKAWIESRNACLSANTDLVVLDTRQKHRSLLQHLATLKFWSRGAYRRVWIGMTRFGGRNYQWVGHQPSWAVWAPGVPNHRGGDCCQIFRGGVANVPCSQLRHFVCEIHDTY